jgi:predicted house-cleaning noncanonical NTP pyrophosphatase (MazG superfamily)
MSRKTEKLVRDRIPEIILKHKQTPKIRILKDAEYLKELKKKLLEETTELLEAKTKEEVLNESSDILEIVDAIGQYNKITFNQTLKNKEKKKKERGAFKKRIYLIDIKERRGR